VHSPTLYQRKTEILPLEPSKGANKWWARPLSNDAKWETLEHNGILFAPDYEPHGVRMLYDGAPVDLTPEQEEVATFYAAMLETDFMSNAKFNANFFADWQQLLGRAHTIKELAKCDFSPIKRHLDIERDRKKEERKTAEFKKKSKETKAGLDALYGFAIVDGFKESTAKYSVEIPGLFRGRGGHPKTGKVKRRVMPEDVILNIGRDTPIPACPLPGHDWKGIVHNPQVTWLAYYKDPITNGYKYVYLASSSRFKGESDRNKYNKARRLITHIDAIRESYTRDLASKDRGAKQRATAVYLIDKLALRVGNEKDTSEEADTVGCCSLRVEHLAFKEDNKVEFDFLGKDSMRYFNEVEVHPLVYTNLKDFCERKRRDADVFDALTTTQLNEHLKNFMPGLSAKVFRTYNASITLEKELREGALDVDVTDLTSVKEQFYTNANREVAILCNHQRSLPKAHDTQMAVLDEQIKKVADELAALKGKATTFGDKKLPTDKNKRTDAAARLETRLKNMETKRAMKDENKTVALGTSKINYMDPRITIAWCKEKDVPLEKIFNKSLLSKFPWAMEIPSTWRFNDVLLRDM
jgi:DNA topoisomerase-1